MTPDSRFLKMSLEFWANVRTISEKLGYTDKQPGYITIPGYLCSPKVKVRRNNTVKVPAVADIQRGLAELHLSSSHIVDSGQRLTDFGKQLCSYFEYRAGVLNSSVQYKLMNAPEAGALYEKEHSTRPALECPQPMNKQKGPKRAKAFLTCLVNMMISANSQGYPCSYDPQQLTKLTKEEMPFRTLARRLDGAFPTAINPIAVWEIKEYYYTTTFGSRIADGVYETMLDGGEIAEARQHGNDVEHVLIVDSHYTWWGCGKPYLCRLVDMLHMGYVDEVLFGREVVEQFPRLVNQWVAKAKEAGISTAAAQAQAAVEAEVKVAEDDVGEDDVEEASEENVNTTDDMPVT